ncbi:hypothetical protein TIFTF001_023470 [Ficus carica]|uniref:NHL repeat-containing protein n=1 Tax=Ficus carica TaxID=3494 RepID=A0AA88AUN0_FICCA|nr:hypothetical protein TIFTF001_023470 [Ficus carica]
MLSFHKFQAHAAPADGNVLQFESGYLVETVVEGNDIGVVPYKIRVSEDGELFAVDSVNSNIVRITPPLSQCIANFTFFLAFTFVEAVLVCVLNNLNVSLIGYSRARLVAGSFQGYTGHADGKPSDARFNHPKGVTMDDKGNVYVADPMNLAIRKISDAGVTTIAGGKSNVAGYRDGPSEDAKFSNDFDVVYIRPTCSLLVVDRGNAALRQISLSEEDCDYQYSSISPTDVLMVLGAVLVGYATCILQQGFGPSFFSRMPSEDEAKEKPSEEKHTPIVETPKEEPGWPSFGQLIIDLSKLGLEALGGLFLYFVPSRFRPNGARKGLMPLKDTLRMPEDEAGQPPLVQRQSAPTPLSETRQVHTPTASVKYSDMKPPKIKSSSLKDPIKSSSFRDTTVSTKHRSSKRQEYAEFYGSGEVPPGGRSKSQKERSRHRQREKSGEVVFGAEQKPDDVKAVDYDNLKFGYNMRSRYGPNNSFRF